MNGYIVQKIGAHRDGILTPTEVKVLEELVKDGMGNKEIGDRISMTEHTVKYHLGQIMEYLDIPNRTALVLWWIRKGRYAQAGYSVDEGYDDGTLYFDWSR